MQLRLASPSAFLPAFLTALAVSACSPSLTPLYQDYAVQTHSVSVETRIRAALAEAGWQTVPASAPNAIATQERKFSSWIIYRVVVSLEVIPVGGEYVRLYVHPYRRYFTGGRGKIPYLNKGLRNAVLKDLDAAFARHGLQAIGTSVERDKKTTAG